MEKTISERRDANVCHVSIGLIIFALLPGFGVRLPLIGAGMLVRTINTTRAPLHRNKAQAYRRSCLSLRFSLLLITFLAVGMW